VFVHGALHDHSVWTLLARWFAHHGHGVLAVDLPAHGGSEGPPCTDVEAGADWLLALLDAAGVRRAALAGHSMGSLIALEAAARAPERHQAGDDRLHLSDEGQRGAAHDRARAPLGGHRHGQRVLDLDPRRPSPPTRGRACGCTAATAR
jgi:pimeloyl-ACP methyl ester carboxylesterase